MAISANKRNVLVGALVLVALIVMASMLLEFSGHVIRFFGNPQLTVHFQCTRADGLSSGSAVNYLGVNVGRVESVRRKPDGSGVLIDATLDRKPPLPANVRAVISSNNALGGTATLNLDIDGGKAEGELQDNAHLTAKYVGLQLNLLPPETMAVATQIGQMSGEIAKVAKDLHESGAIADLDATVKQAHITAAKAADVLDSVNTIVADPKTSENFQAALANIRTASEGAAKLTAKLDTLADKLGTTSDNVSTSLKSANGNIDKLSKSMGDRLTQVSAVLTNIQQITDKINNGKGTAGELVNDGRMYAALVDSTQELSATVKDLHRLIDQWEQEGVSLKVH